MASTDRAPEARLRWQTTEQTPALPGLEAPVVHPEFAGLKFLHVRAKTIINKVPGAAHLPFGFTINAYRGCSHDCVYCFARPSHQWLELDPAEEFGSVIVVKVNAVERLRAELRAPSWRGQHIALGTNTDPYQRCEGRYRLTAGIVQTLTEAGNPFSVLTKGTLVTRDLDLLTTAARRGICTNVSLSIPTLDEDVWRASEPGTPHPAARLRAVAALADAGIPTGVMIAPIIPGLSDHPDQLEEVVAKAVDAGASSITPIVLHLRRGVKELVEPWLADLRPELLARYRELYQGTYAQRPERDRIGTLVRNLVARHRAGSRAAAAPSASVLARTDAEVADREGIRARHPAGKGRAAVQASLAASTTTTDRSRPGARPSQDHDAQPVSGRQLRLL